MDLIWFQESFNASATATVTELLHNPDQEGVNIGKWQRLQDTDYKAK